MTQCTDDVALLPCAIPRAAMSESSGETKETVSFMTACGITSADFVHRVLS
jgi:hypothetical protein